MWRLAGGGDQNQPLQHNRRKAAVFHQLLEVHPDLFMPGSRTQVVEQYLDDMARVGGLGGAVDAVRGWDGLGKPSSAVTLIERAMGELGTDPLEYILRTNAHLDADLLSVHLRRPPGAQKAKSNWWARAVAQAAPTPQASAGAGCGSGQKGENSPPKDIWLSEHAVRQNHQLSRDWLIGADVGGKSPLRWLSECRVDLQKNNPIRTDNLSRIETGNPYRIFAIKPSDTRVRLLARAFDDHIVIVWWGKHDDYMVAINRVDKMGAMSSKKGELIYSPNAQPGP